MDQFIDEVNEDLKKEKYEEVWKKYGQFVIGGAVAVLIATGGYSFWKSWSEEKAATEGTRFDAAIQAIGNESWDDANSQLEAFKNDAGDGYRGLALIRQGEVLQAKGDNAAALAVWETLAADSGVDAVYRDFGLLMSVTVNLDNMDVNQVKSRLGTLAGSTSGWRHLAQEQIALAAITAGDKDEATQLLNGLIADADAPQGLKQRAGNYLAVLSVQ